MSDVTKLSQIISARTMDFCGQLCSDELAEKFKVAIADSIHQYLLSDSIVLFNPDGTVVFECPGLIMFTTTPAPVEPDSE